MFLDDSAVSAAGLLHSALILTSHALSEISKSKNPSVIAQHVTVELIEAQVSDVIAQMTKSEKVPGASNQAPVEMAIVPMHQSSESLYENLILNEEPKQPGMDLSCPPEMKETLISEDAANISLTLPSAHKESLVSMLRRDKSHRETIITAQAAFRTSDLNHDGFLSEDELRQAFLSVGIDECKVDDAVRNFYEKVECVGNERKIDLKTFVAFLSSEKKDGDHELTALVRNGFDSASDDLIAAFNHRTEDMVIGESKSLLDPRSRLSINWDIAVGMLLIQTVITMPLSMAFELAQKPLKPLDVMADVIFVMDITKHFNSGYIDEYEFIIMDRKQVRENYLYGWFLPDMMSSLPVELLDVVFTGLLPANLKATKALKLLRLSRLAKVFRILKLPKLAKLLIDLQDGIEDHFEIKFDEAKIAIASLFMGLLVVAHWVGCISYMLAAEFGFPDDSWVVNAGLVDQPLGTQYSWSIFKALMTMIGAGFEDPPIVNTVCTERTTWCTIEHWNTLICLYIGSVFYALLIASVSDIMANLNKGGSALAEQLWGLNEYLAYKKVPISMKNRVRNFFRIQYSDGKMYDQAKLLQALPPQIKDGIVIFIHKDLFAKVPLLCAETTPSSFLAKLAPALSVRVVFGGEVVIKEDTSGDEMFFIDSGIVQIFSKHCDFVVKALADGCYFGDVACLLGCKRTATIKTRTNMSLYALKRESLLVAFTDLPGIHKKMMDTANKRQKRMLLLDESSINLDFNEEDIEDEEDASTKYFIDIKGPKEPVEVPKSPKEGSKMKKSFSFNSLLKHASPPLSSSPKSKSSEELSLEKSHKSLGSLSAKDRGAKRREELFPTKTTKIDVRKTKKIDVRKKDPQLGSTRLENGAMGLPKRIDIRRGNSRSSASTTGSIGETGDSVHIVAPGVQSCLNGLSSSGGGGGGKNENDQVLVTIDRPPQEHALLRPSVEAQSSPSGLSSPGGGGGCGGGGNISIMADDIGRSSVTADRPPTQQEFDPIFHPENIPRERSWNLSRTKSEPPASLDTQY